MRFRIFRLEDCKVEGLDYLEDVEVGFGDGRDEVGGWLQQRADVPCRRKLPGKCGKERDGVLLEGGLLSDVVARSKEQRGGSACVRELQGSEFRVQDRGLNVLGFRGFGNSLGT